MANCPNCGRPVTDAVPGRSPYHLYDGTPIGSSECKNRGKTVFMATGVNCMTTYLTVETDGSVSLLADEGYYKTTLSAGQAALLSGAIQWAVFNHAAEAKDDG